MFPVSRDRANCKITNVFIIIDAWIINRGSIFLSLYKCLIKCYFLEISHNLFLSSLLLSSILDFRSKFFFSFEGIIKKERKENGGEGKMAREWVEYFQVSHLLPAFENMLDFEVLTFSRYSGISRFRKARWILSPPFFFDALFCDTETNRMRIRDEHESW